MFFVAFVFIVSVSLFLFEFSTRSGNRTVHGFRFAAILPPEINVFSVQTLLERNRACSSRTFIEVPSNRDVPRRNIAQVGRGDRRNVRLRGKLQLRVPYFDTGPVFRLLPIFVQEKQFESGLLYVTNTTQAVYTCMYLMG